MNPIQVCISALLIMSSMLMGFQVDRWWEEKRERSVENDYLGRLLLDLETDEISLGRRIEYFSAIRDFASLGLEFLEMPEIGEGRETEILVALYLASHAWQFTPANSTFEELKSSGNLTLISNVELRNDILVYHLDLNNANYVWQTTNYYRRTARSLIPAKVQRAMWDACHELKDQSASQRFLANCKLEYSDEVIRSILHRLKNFPTIEGDLNFLAANVEVSIVLYNEHLHLTRDLLAKVAASLANMDHSN